MKEQSHHHQQQQQMTTRSISNAANLTSLCVDISPSCSSFFEVSCCNQKFTLYYLNNLIVGVIYRKIKSVEQKSTRKFHR